jgi:Flp pilus assembly protein TadB
MDLSNRESAEYWHQRAEAVTDPELRREALATFREFRKMAEREERARLRRQKPGYGVRSMLGWIILLSLIVLAAILWLSKIFSVTVVCTVFGVAIGLCIVAAAVTLRVYGHISEDSMLAMIQKGLAGHSTPGTSKTIEASVGADGTSSAKRQLSSDVSEISRDDDASEG